MSAHQFPIEDISSIHQAAQTLESLAKLEHPAAEHCARLARELRRIVMREYATAAGWVQSDDGKQGPGNG